MDEEKKFIVDIAEEKEYRNQSEKYHKAFTEWRNKSESPLAYRFVHDSREHIYVDGEGFADKSLEAAERNALYKSYTFLGGMMIIFLVFRLTLYILMKYYFDIPYYGWFFASETDAVKNIPGNIVYFYSGLNILSYIIVLLVGLFYLRKLPKFVLFPAERFKPRVVGATLSVVLMFMVMTRIIDYALEKMCNVLGFDAIRCTFLYTDDTAAWYVYCAFELLIIPILCEFLFRGVILQFFRQFGDVFAITISAICFGLSYVGLSNAFSMMILGLILGFVVVRTGSVYSSIIIRCAYMSFSLLLDWIGSDNFNLSMKFLEICFCIIILLIAYFVLSGMNISFSGEFKFDSEGTELSFKKKMRLFFTSNLFIVWIAFSLVISILLTRMT